MNTLVKLKSLTILMIVLCITFLGSCTKEDVLQKDEQKSTANVINIQKTSGNPPITCESCPAIHYLLRNEVEDPDDIDAATTSLNAPAILVNYHLASPYDLSFLGLGLDKGVYLPRQISTREGGRKSQYYLDVDESVMAGLITTEDGLMLVYVTRLTGTTATAQTGDIFREQWKSLNGDVIFEAEGALEILDAEIGKGQISLEQTSTTQYALATGPRIFIWYFWSMHRVEVELDC